MNKYKKIFDRSDAPPTGFIVMKYRHFDAKDEEVELQEYNHNRAYTKLIGIRLVDAYMNTYDTLFDITHESIYACEPNREAAEAFCKERGLHIRRVRYINPGPDHKHEEAYSYEGSRLY